MIQVTEKFESRPTTIGRSSTVDLRYNIAGTDDDQEGHGHSKRRAEYDVLSVQRQGARVARLRLASARPNSKKAGGRLIPCFQQAGAGTIATGWFEFRKLGAARRRGLGSSMSPMTILSGCRSTSSRPEHG